MELGDPALSDAEYLADLFEAEVLVVVQVDDLLLSVWQAGERILDPLCSVGLSSRLPRGVVGAWSISLNNFFSSEISASLARSTITMAAIFFS